ncbi:rhodanese-related sulfurtransferase [Chitinispirillum alkaliphilum]|nr:rhodanese-related sulfurtransferase [Chitinispirillum alkaliphilum]
MEEITTPQLLELLDDPEVKIIDVRPTEAYNGWRNKGEKRGGHIKTAKSLPLKWTSYFDWPEIVKEKKIRPADRLVIYGYNRDEAQKVASLFLRAGYQNLSLYDHFLHHWDKDHNLPVSKLTRYKQLVSPAWLRQLISDGTASGFNSERYCICHCYYRDSGSYDKGHIPGAVPLDTNSLESPITWNRKTPEEIKTALEQLGITHDTTVVLYGTYSFPRNDDPFPGSSAGHLGAMRCALLMLYAGVEDVRLLNGGFQAWTDEGFEISKEHTTPRAVASFGITVPKYPHLMIDTEEARKYLQSEDKNLVCVRSWSEYIGEVSGYNYIKKRGRIPGAVFADCGSDAYHMENYRNPDHTTREFGEIHSMWANSGITKDKHNAFYCGTGWRGSEAFVNAWLMGWKNISVYDGGWYEWSSDETNPTETGVPD